MINKHRQAERHKHFRHMLERATLSEIKEMIKKIDLKICDMKQTLNLTIQRKWFDMIAQGIKTEEYRDCENRQVQRAYLWAANDHYWYESKPVAILRNGYRMDSRALVVRIVGFDLRGRESVKHPEWGEPKCRRLHIAVILGEVLFNGKYADAKQWLKKENFK